MDRYVSMRPADLAMRRLVWACIGAACTAPVVWLWASWVARNDAALVAQMDRAGFVAMCREENAVAVEIINSGTIMCASGSGRRLTAPLAHPLKGSR